MDASEKIDRGLNPYTPVAKKPTPDAHENALVAAGDDERSDEVEQDMIVVAGIEGDSVLRLSCDNAANDIQCPVAVERRDLYSDDIVDLGKTAPEGGRKNETPDRRLQIEPNKGNLLRNRPA